MDKGALAARWATLEGRKGTLHSDNEKYAAWTLPYVYPQASDVKNTSPLPGVLDSIGARAVNHLSNRLIGTLFPAYRSFLRLDVTSDVRAQFENERVPIQEVEQALARGERDAMRDLDKMAHRTVSTEAAKLLIITGNALMYYPIGSGRCQVYSTRDYCVVRDLSGTVIEIVTRDVKAFETFNADVQAKLRDGQDKSKPYEDATNVILYTQIKLNDKGKFEIKQAADNLDLETQTNEYAKEDLPWLPLTWNLPRGADYGRGMVEDYRGAFGALEVLTGAITEGAVVAAQLKFLVRPDSVVDVKQLNESANGSYHAGREGDVTVIRADKHMDFQQVQALIDGHVRQIATAFLLTSAVTRDAERVTAEEIRYQAQELETAYGGVYSRFTEDWQNPLARRLMKMRNVSISDKTIDITIVTGMDTLSRMGDLDNYAMFVRDLAGLGSLPPDVTARINIAGLMQFLGVNRGLDYTKFTKTEEQFAAEQQQAMAQQQQMMQAETGNKMVADASKEISKQEAMNG